MYLKILKIFISPSDRGRRADCRGTFQLKQMRNSFLAAAFALALFSCNLAHSQMTPKPPGGIDPYDYRWELYGAGAYTHFQAGAAVGSINLAGFDGQAARFFNSHWAVAAGARGYYGSTSVAPNSYSITNPSVSVYLYLGGVEYRIPRNDRLSLTLHALGGSGYGIFNSDLKSSSGTTLNPEVVGLYKNQSSRFSGAFGGALDFNLSERWAVRVSPEATLTDFQSSSGAGGLTAHYAATAGLVYRFSPRTYLP